MFRSKPPRAALPRAETAGDGPGGRFVFEGTQTMTAVSKWVAAGSSAAVFAGGLFIGAPTAIAAPGDAACQQASVQFEAALAAAGITEESIARLDALAEVTASAEAAFMAAQQAIEDGPGAALAAAEAQLAADEAAKDAAEDALVEAQTSGDPDAIAAAQAAYDAADDARGESRDALELRQAEYDAAWTSQEFLDVKDAFDTAVAAFEQELAAVSLDEGSAASLAGLFEAFLAACNPDSVGVDPVVTPPVTVPDTTTPGGTTPAVANPVTAAPTGVGTTPGAGVGTATVATNKGLNVQTAAETEPGGHPGLALLAALLAAGISVPAAVALRMRRLERGRN